MSVWRSDDHRVWRAAIELDIPRIARLRSVRGDGGIPDVRGNVQLDAGDPRREQPELFGRLLHDACVLWVLAPKRALERPLGRRELPVLDLRARERKENGRCCSDTRHALEAVLRLFPLPVACQFQ